MKKPPISATQGSDGKIKVSLDRSALQEIKTHGLNRFPTTVWSHPISPEMAEKLREFLANNQTHTIPDSIEPVVPPEDEQEVDDDGNPAPSDPPNEEGLCEECGGKCGSWIIDPFMADVRYQKVWIFVCRDCKGIILDSI